MSRLPSMDDLKKAFENDGYNVVATAEKNGKRGIRAESKTAVNYETKKPKAVFYVEGGAYEMGYLTGVLGHEEAEEMITIFLKNIMPTFLKTDPNKKKWMWALGLKLLKWRCKRMKKDIPQYLQDEMHGLVDGCKSVNSKTKVSFNSVFALNVGFDYLLSAVYNLQGLWETVGLDHNHLKIPIFCNAFGAFGKATSDGKCYFGRDFMFPDAGAFQNAAAMIIYRPDDAAHLPLVAVTAPGFVGSIAAMNNDGVAMGVDMSPAANNNHKRPGLNSLLLVRHTMHMADSAEKAVKVITDAQRGVTWIYPIADGKNNRAVIVEAGAKMNDMHVLGFPPKDLKKNDLLPNEDFLKKHSQAKLIQGLMARWDDYDYPTEFFDFNDKLFAHYGKTYVPADAGETGFFDKNRHGKNLPSAYYFAPQREAKDDLVLTTNLCVTPAMRIAGMDKWTIKIAGDHYDDVQWRYDALNSILIENYGKIDFEKAVEIIAFLAPNGKYFTHYFEHNPRSSDGKTMQIGGSTSACDLTDKVITSHYGYFADEWVSLTLPNYM